MASIVSVALSFFADYSRDQWTLSIAFVAYAGTASENRGRARRSFSVGGCPDFPLSGRRSSSKTSVGGFRAAIRFAKFYQNNNKK